MYDQLRVLVVSTVNTGGLGCIALANAGDAGGFFDPCDDVHFDAWGRVAKGGPAADLMLSPIDLSEDRETLRVDIGPASALR